MNVLLAAPRFTNPYVSNCAAALRLARPDWTITWGVESFWRSKRLFDVIHIQWPEALLKGRAPRGTAADLGNRLRRLKEEGTALVITRHNRHPHRNIFPCYESVYSEIATVVHLGNASVGDFESMYGGQPWYAGSTQFVVQHPNYTNFPNAVDRDQARRLLRLPKEAKVILVFGEVRSTAESQFILDTFDNIRLQNKLLLAPRWRCTDNAWAQRMRQLLYRGFERPLRLERRLRSRRAMCIGYGTVADHDVQLFLNSCDVVLIPRLSSSTLNSGNVALGFTFGRVVVGCDIGVIGESLADRGNPVFERGNVSDAARELERVLSRDNNELEAANLRYANTEMSWEIVGEQLASVYEKVTAPKFC